MNELGILAQVAGQSHEAAIAAWIVGAAGALAIVNQGTSLFARLKSKPQPSEVQLEARDRFATQSAMEKLDRTNADEHARIFAKLGGVERGSSERHESTKAALRSDIDALRRDVDTKSDAKFDALHEKFNDVAKGLAALTASQDQLTPRIAVIESDVKRLLARQGDK